ncbi:MAG: class I SAM-dependent RNA methyltransferase, partial [Spirochaetia bacterium]|nr:class I SAM-dependent RNA methyltransferase [Spirochaetia bacterium]
MKPETATEKTIPMNSGDSARPGDITEVAVQDLGEGGEGIGKLPDGLTCFVPGLLPGESGKVRIAVRKKNYATGKLLERTFTSSERVEPPCPYFEECGGCQIMHLRDAAQLEMKRSQVGQALQRISGISIEVPPLIPSPSMLGYRNKLSLPVKGTSREPLIGFYKRGSHHAVDIAKCRVGLMAHEGILRTLRTWTSEKRIPIYVEKIAEGLLRHIVIRSSRDGSKIMVVLVVREEVPVLRSAAQLFFNREGLPSREVTSLYLNVNENEGNAILGKKSMLLGG